MLKGGGWCGAIIIFIALVAVGAWLSYRFGTISHIRGRSIEMINLDLPRADEEYDDLQVNTPTHDPRSYDIKKQISTTAKPINQNLFESLQIASDDLPKQPKHSSVKKKPSQYVFPTHSVLMPGSTKATQSR